MNDNASAILFVGGFLTGAVYGLIVAVLFRRRLSPTRRDELDFEQIAAELRQA